MPSRSISYMSGGYGQIGPMPSSTSRTRRVGEACIENMIKVAIIALFIVFVFPEIVAPQLGVTPEQYQSMLYLWVFIAGLVALPFAWLGAKLLSKMIRMDR